MLYITNIPCVKCKRNTLHYEDRTCIPCNDSSDYQNAQEDARIKAANRVVRYVPFDYSIEPDPRD